MIALTEEQSAFLQRCGIDPANLDLNVMSRLFDDLLQANRRTNLTRILDADEFWNLHVLDSLSVGMVLPEIMSASLRVADVGCGAGFPLFPLAWANPNLEITGIESRGKKAEFIQKQAATSGWNNVHVVNLRAREAGRKNEWKERFDLVLLRAVGSARKMLRECRRFLKSAPEAKIIFYKTPAAVEAELPDARREADKFRLQPATSSAFTLPENSGERQFLLFSPPEKKIRKTL